MTTTVEERLLTEITTRLDRISIANGFSFDGLTIRTSRNNTTGQLFKPRTFRIVDGGVSDAPNYDRPGNPPARGKLLTVAIEAIGLSSDGNEDAEQLDPASMLAAAEKAITNPPDEPALWWRFGDLAVDADFGAAEPMDPLEGRLTGRTLTLLVYYRTDENDPFTARP